MRKILNNDLFNHYIVKHAIENILDKEILKHAQLHFYEKEEHILEAETNLEYYYLLVDGKIKISYLFENGKSMLLKFYKEFNTIGDLELLKNIPIRCNIDAVEDTYLIAIPSDILRRQYVDNVKLLHHLVDSLSEKLYATINNTSYNFVYPLINRLSSYLIEHITDKNYIILNASFLEIAQFLGTTYRHLNRTFKDLESKEIIKLENKTVYILDEDRLQELSKNLYIKSL
ncbi:MAG: cyclic nucleotide-binding domain protein [Anaerosolibacter sp.]|jgi:CRP-like cAMP-binding protein|uniref:Crp/Fnr family transcriptional regulator n=1 Tax=Anaerosolibacter sp. TaxID=1872527 RepID=UPI00260625FC|nr:helix-turn-helix domain-containing protein [Anaerosolibacter sp.]MDF2548288.1 cyclic nucleotide-binding domain protein [Anaerosolibacter sp.]